MENFKMERLVLDKHLIKEIQKCGLEKLDPGAALDFLSEKIDWKQMEGNPVFNNYQMEEIHSAFKTGLPKEIVEKEIANPDFSAEEMAERREKLDEELYKLGKEGLLEKYGIVPEKENSMEENETEKDENTLDASEEMSL